MYIVDAVAPLVATLAAVTDEDTRIYIAHGRNRQVGFMHLFTLVPSCSVD